MVLLRSFFVYEMGVTRSDQTARVRPRSAQGCGGSGTFGQNLKLATHHTLPLLERKLTLRNQHPQHMLLMTLKDSLIVFNELTRLLVVMVLLRSFFVYEMGVTRSDHPKLNNVCRPFKIITKQLPASKNFCRDVVTLFKPAVTYVS